jgi:hypothetical protein
MGVDRSAPLGEILVRRGFITFSQLDGALQLQLKTGGRLGDILIAQGLVRYDSLYGCVAESMSLPFVNLLVQPPDAGLPDAEDREDYLRLRMMPWRQEGKTVCVAVCEINFEVMMWLRQRFGIHTRLVVTSPLDITRTVMLLFGRNIEEDSRLKLWQAMPHASARSTLTPRQRQAALAYGCGGAALLVAFPGVSLLALAMFCHVAYTATMLFKCGVFFAGSVRRKERDWNRRLASLDAHSLPVYTVLVPMYKEAASLPGLLEAMERLDYPVLCSSLPKTTL